jgi:hypothetical protein
MLLTLALEQRAFELAFNFLLNLVYGILAVHCEATKVYLLNLSHYLLCYSNVYDLVISHHYFLTYWDLSV